MRDQRRKANILGTEYIAYAEWTLRQARPAMDKFTQKILPAEFAKAMHAIDYNDDDSLYDFTHFLYRPNFVPIKIGTVGRNSVILIPEPAQLHQHDMSDEIYGSVQDSRPSVSPSILGIWNDWSSFEVGQHPDVSKVSKSDGSDHTTTEPPRPSCSSGSLEVFQQLGLLYWEDIGSKSGLKPSNYILVTNVYDDSIWVIWRKYIKDQNTAEEDLAKDVWQDEYAMFPGMPTEEGLKETIIYAMVAENWDSLEPPSDDALLFSHIFPAPPSGNPIEEPILVSACRTAQGGIRRLNDARSMPPRPQRAWVKK